MVNRNNILGDISLVQRALETSPIRLGQLVVDPITADQQARYQ